MENRKSLPSGGTPRAVVLAALLHILIVAFLALNVMPCSTFEKFYETVGLPASLNPLKCPAPIQLPGQIIEAVLIGPTGSPPPKATKVKPVPDSTPPPPSVPAPTPPQPEKPKVETLAPPPPKPDLKDQERVVQDALVKAEDAKREQEEKQRQRQAEIDAEAQKAKKQKEVDEIFKQLDAAKAQTKTAENRKKQAEQQLKDLANAKDDSVPDVPAADQRQTGNNGADTGLLGKYQAALQNAVTTNWLRPDNMPDVSCVVHIVQLPGGQVMSAKVDSSCPYDEAGRRSLENAVLRAQPLPYQGFESVFQRNLDFTFRPQ
jgi:colicin import membrane protein